MRISEIRIQNYRAFRDETISFDDYTCFVGPNGAGKSTILNALNVVFRDQSDPSDVNNLVEEDFHLKRTSKPIEITVTFTGLCNEAKEELSAYVRQDKLMIKAKAEWDPSAQLAEVMQYGVRDVIQDFAPYFKADDDGASAEKLKNIYKDIRSEYPDLPDEWVKAEMRSALREYEEAHPGLCEPVDSSDQFYGWSRGVNRLERYIQWVYIPAVKDPTEEQEEARGTALGELLSRTIRAKVDFDSPLADLRMQITERYQSLVEDQKDALDELQASIESRLQEWSHPGVSLDLHWHYDPEKSVTLNEPSARAKVGEGEFMGEMVRVGHGLQRSFLVAVLQEEALTGTEEAPTLLLAIEEPELYQHPPQARHLATVLDRLSSGSGQVMLTTHSPYFVSSKGFENIRITRKKKNTSEAAVAKYTPEELSEAIAEAIGDEVREPTATMAAVEQIMMPSRSELYFSQVPVLVEGQEDIAFFTAHIRLRDHWERFRSLGCHFVECGGKTNLSRPLAIANGFGIPAFAVIDADRSDGEQRERNETDNKCIINLCEEEAPPFPESPFIGERLVIWPDTIREAIRTELSEEDWDNAEQSARETFDLEGVSQKDPLLITATLELLAEAGVHSSLIDSACDALFQFALKSQ